MGLYLFAPYKLFLQHRHCTRPRSDPLYGRRLSHFLQYQQVVVAPATSETGKTVFPLIQASEETGPTIYQMVQVAGRQPEAQTFGMLVVKPGGKFLTQPSGGWIPDGNSIAANGGGG